MGQDTKIEWTDHTFNAWTGCSKVSPGCAHCYAEGWAKRSGVVTWGGPRRRTSETNWRLPVKWNKAAGIEMRSWHAFCESFGASESECIQAGFDKPSRPRVFCSSLADWLDDEVPIDWLADLMRLICETPNLDWLLLTKRPENFASRMRKAYMEACCGSLEADNMMGEWEDGTPPPNVWIGTTVEDQQRADERIPLMLSIPARVRFLSCEPLLEPVYLQFECDSPDEDAPEGAKVYRDALNPGFCIKPIHWVIVGGESGPKARPMHPDWARSLRNQCEAAGVPFFMKQMGGTRKPFPEIPSDLDIRQFPTP